MFVKFNAVMGRLNATLASQVSALDPHPLPNFLHQPLGNAGLGNYELPLQVTRTDGKKKLTQR